MPPNPIFYFRTGSETLPPFKTAIAVSNDGRVSCCGGTTCRPLSYLCRVFKPIETAAFDLTSVSTGYSRFNWRQEYTFAISLHPSIFLQNHKKRNKKIKKNSREKVPRGLGLFSFLGPSCDARRPAFLLVM